MRLVGIAAFAALALAFASAAFARTWHVAEILACLRWHCGLVSAGAAVVFVLVRQKRLAVAFAVLAAADVWPAIEQRLRTVERGADGTAVTVATLNLAYVHGRPADIRAWLDGAKPDLAAVLEVGPLAFQAIEGLAPLFPHRRLTRATPETWKQPEFGIGLLSRWPIEQFAVRPLAPDAIPFLEARVRVDDAAVQVIVVHLMNPRTAAGMRARDAALERIAREVEWREPSIVLGDFNATVFSPALRSFLDAAALADARTGGGRLPTWFPPGPLGMFGLDLDRILLRGPIAVRGISVGPDLGSDHRPLQAELVLRGP